MRPLVPPSPSSDVGFPLTANFGRLAFFCDYGGWLLVGAERTLCTCADLSPLK